MDKAWPIHIQGSNRGPARWRQANEMGALFVPDKMVGPRLLAWVKERRLLVRLGINGRLPGIFMAITFGAGQT